MKKPNTLGRVALPFIMLSAAACAAEVSAGERAESVMASEAALRPAAGVTLLPLGTYESGLYAQSAAEITAHDPVSQRLFVVNATNGRIDVLDVSDPTVPTKI